MNRRLFFINSVKTIATIGAFGSGVFTSTKIFAQEALDKGIKKFKYVHELASPLKGAAKTHLKKLLKKIGKFEEVKVSEEDQQKLLPTCQYCKFWEESEGGYAHCRYVAKKGNKKGQKAYQNAWCSMFKPVSKEEDFKKRMALKTEEVKTK